MLNKSTALFSLLVFLSAAQYLSFTYNGFQSVNLTLDGIAEITNNGLLRLTNETVQKTGHAFYPHSVKFKDSPDGSVTSFSTTFVFAIISEYADLSGHGIAFVIAPTRGLPGALPSQYIGLFNEANNGNASNHVVAVELDTIQSNEFNDINNNHVGIDINGLHSNISLPAAYNDDSSNSVKNISLISGKAMQVWVQYDGLKKEMNVSIAPVKVKKPSVPLLSLSIDLSPIIKSSMFIGFSSATGGEDGNVESNSGGGGGGSSDVEEKRKARLLRNRESAQMSRQRKKQHVEELEDKVRSMHSTIADLNNRISYVLAENASLRQQLSGNGACAQPPPGMYPQPQMGPMCYPWMPYSPYVVKPQGSQVPLVPIPRLKPQHSVSASKGKKSEGKKSSEGRTKKVASITFVGLLFFILLLGGMVPMINLRFGGLTDNVSSVGREFYEQHRGRILDVDGHSNGSGLSVSVRYSNEKCDINNRIHHSGGTGNCDEQYAISLQVPRDNKVVKIDGNLIYHSVRASEEAVASQVKSEANKREETSLAVRSDLAAALAIPEFKKNRGKNPHVYRNPTERQRALSSGSVDSLKDQPKSSVDGRLQQWFSEGLAGPILSSGMCTEVFQFDVSPTSSPGAIVPASAISNVSAERRQNATHHYKGRNRRILQGIPVSLPGSTVNNTEEQVKRASPKDGFQGNKSGSSMVVSVLVDPREVGDGSGDSSMVGPKSLSRIFVVVLLDSVKYVTYSCMLPGVAPHLVAA